MLPIYIHDIASGDYLTLILAVMLCCMLPTIFRQPSASKEKPESDSWYVNSGIQEAYDTFVSEVDEWRGRSISQKKGMFSNLSRRKPKVFSVTNKVPPRLLTVNDEKAGQITFEFAEMDGGNTSVKATYDATARTLIQNFKAKIPIKIALPTQVSPPGPRLCPSCGKEMLPDYKVCPFCETKLN